MKLSNNNTPKRYKSGMTLLELTVVILVLLSLISILFIGANAWKKGADRTGCIMNIRNTQQGVRSYQNLYGIVEGATFDMVTDIMGINGYISAPVCPSNGTYSYLTTIPAPGVLSIECTLATSDKHLPASFGDW